MLVDRLRRGDRRLGGDRKRPPAVDRAGHLRTADATSPVPAASIAGTLALFVLVYGVVFSIGIYYINRLIAQGPQSGAPKKPDDSSASRCRHPAAHTCRGRDSAWNGISR